MLRSNLALRAGLLACVCGLGSAPAGADTLIVLNKAESTASLVDLATGSLKASVPTGAWPHEAAVSPDGRLAVITNYGGKEPGNSLTVLDVPGARVAKTIDLGEHRRPHGVEWLPDGRHVAVTAERSRALLLVDVEQGRLSAVLATDQEVSHMVALGRDGARAYVANIGSGSVTALDLEAKTRLATVPTGEGAEGIALTPDGGQLWVTNREAETVSVLDPGPLKLIATLESKGFPIRATATPDGRHVLVSNARSGEVAVFDTSERKLARTIALDLKPAGGEGRMMGGRFGQSPVPIGIEVPPDGRRAYIACSAADAVAILDLQEWKVVGTLPAGKEPDGMAWSPLEAGAAR